jgi:intracellular septation protein A
MSFPYWSYPTQTFPLGGHQVAIKSRAFATGLETRIFVDGALASRDFTPALGAAAVRNHRHALAIAGDAVEVEAGYVGLWAIGAIVRRDGVVIHETHPGRPVAFPEAFRETALNSTFTGEKWRANRVPLAVDVLSGLLFFVVAKLAGLQAAALVAAAVGVLLVLGERALKIDLTGGLALFGIAMLLISAGLAWVFDDPEMIKLRSTITGLIASTLFLGDGLFGGRRLAGKTVRYLPWSDIDAGRLGIGLGLTGFVMAALNYAVAKLFSTDAWLVYTTFLDTPVSMAMVLLVFAYARGRLGRRPAAAA